MNKLFGFRNSRTVPPSVPHDEQKGVIPPKGVTALPKFVEKYEIVRSNIMETILLKVVGGKIEDVVLPEKYSGAKPIIKNSRTNYELSWDDPAKSPKIFGIIATPWSEKPSRSLSPIVGVTDSSLNISFTNGNIEVNTNFWLIVHINRVRTVPVGNLSRVI